MAVSMVPGELVRLRSVATDEWLVACAPFGDFDDSLSMKEDADHKIYTMKRESLPDAISDMARARLDGKDLCWENTGFIVREGLDGEPRTEDGSGKQLVRLDAARFVDAFLYAPEGSSGGWFDKCRRLCKMSGKKDYPTEDSTRLRMCAKEKIIKSGDWARGLFVVEDASTGVRLRSKALPERYLVASADCAKGKGEKQRTRVFMVPRDAIADWETTIFEVKHEGTHAAERQERHARMDRKLRGEFRSGVNGVVMALMGIGGLIAAFVGECPGVPYLWELVVAFGCVGLCAPIAKLVTLFFTYKQVMRGRPPAWAGCVELLIGLTVLSLAIAIASLSWPAGYNPGDGPASREEAVEAWEAAHPGKTPPEDLAFCSASISSMAFLGPLITFAIWLLIMGVTLYSAVTGRSMSGEAEVGYVDSEKSVSEEPTPNATGDDSEVAMDV